MDNLISRQAEAAIDAIDTYIGNFDALDANFLDGLKTAKKLIMRLPSAQLDIIRCKDCKHYDDRPCGIVDWYNTADDFCSRAERKNNV